MKVYVVLYTSYTFLDYFVVSFQERVHLGKDVGNRHNSDGLVRGIHDPDSVHFCGDHLQDHIV